MAPGFGRPGCSLVSIRPFFVPSRAPLPEVLRLSGFALNSHQEVLMPDRRSVTRRGSSSCTDSSPPDVERLVSAIEEVAEALAVLSDTFETGLADAAD